MDIAEPQYKLAKEKVAGVVRQIVGGIRPDPADVGARIRYNGLLFEAENVRDLLASADTAVTRNIHKPWTASTLELANGEWRRAIGASIAAIRNYGFGETHGKTLEAIVAEVGLAPIFATQELART